MSTCSEVIKRCGATSTKFVAECNGKTPKTIQNAFNDKPHDFYKYVLNASTQRGENDVADCKRALTDATINAVKNTADAIKILALEGFTHGN